MGFGLQESIPHCCFLFFFDYCFFRSKEPFLAVTAGYMLEVVESILLIILSFICKNIKIMIHSIALIDFFYCNFVCFASEITHSPLLSRDMHLSHKLNKT